MLAAGWLAEVRALLGHYAADLPALSGLGYRELGGHLRGELALMDAVALTKQRTRQFIKRQQTWFRRDARIRWFDITQTGWEQGALAAVLEARG
jgi:tRNA dimethylallyltransferase